MATVLEKAIKAKASPALLIHVPWGVLVSSLFFLNIIVSFVKFKRDYFYLLWP
jgi:hypothetical protein